MPAIVDLIGVPFKNGGRDKSGMDCWGLALEVFRRYKINLIDYKISCNAQTQINGKINTERKNWERCTGELPVPALIVFNDNGICNHVGVYIGENKFIHARIGTGVAIESMDSVFWKRRIEGVYSWLR